MGILYNFLRVLLIFLQGILIFNAYKRADYISVICWCLVLAIYTIRFIKDFNKDRRKKTELER